MRLNILITLTTLTLLHQTLQTSPLFTSFKTQNNIIFPSLPELKKIKKNFEYTIIYYHSNNCKLCKRFSEKYKKIALELEKQKPDFPVVSILCSKKGFSEFCSFHEKIKFFPAIRVFHHSEFVEYEGEFDVLKVFKWLRNRTVHSRFFLKRENFLDLRRLLRKEEIVTVFYNDQVLKKKKKKISREFSILSTLYSFSRFYETDDSLIYEETVELCEKMKNEKIGKKSNLLIFHPDHHRCYFYNGFFDHKKIAKFLKKKEKAKIRLFDEKSLKMSIFYNLPIVIFFHENEENFDFWQNFLELSDHLHDQFFFTHVNKNSFNGKFKKINPFVDEEHEFEKRDRKFVVNIMVELGVTEKNWPSLFVFKKQKNSILRKFRFFGEFRKNEVLKFLKKAHLNQLPLFFKTEDFTKEENEKNLVKKLNSLNFEDTLEKYKKIILLVEGSEELCENCAEIEKALFSAFSNISKKRRNFDFKVFRLNVQLNEVKNWNFEHVPEIIVFGNGADPDFMKDYKGIMSEEFIQEFLENSILDVSDEL